MTDPTEDNETNTFDVRSRDSRGQITTEHNDVMYVRYVRSRIVSSQAHAKSQGYGFVNQKKRVLYSLLGKTR